MRDIRVAAAICRSRINQIPQSIEHITAWVKKARNKGVDILCFPEMNVTGYGIRNTVREVAEPVPGPTTEVLSELASRSGMVLLVGMAEKGKKGDVYASHLVITPGGKTGVYRKLHVAPPEEGIFTPGNRVPVFENRGVTFGIQLCYDAHFPELSTAMAQRGAEVIFFPHASPRGDGKSKLSSWMRHLPARAYDNGVFVVACNASGGNGEGLDFPGVALAIGPDGRVISKCSGKREGLLVVELKKKDLDAVRSNKMRYFFPRRRTKLYQSSR